VKYWEVIKIFIKTSEESSAVPAAQTRKAAAEAAT